jgi:hypothetical protein
MLCALVLLAAPATAQESETLTRDSEDLARRLLGWDGTTALPEVPVIYEPGDTLEFQIGKREAATPTTVTATLTGLTGRVYVWVEQGIPYDANTMQQLAQQLDRLISAVRWRGTYTPSRDLPGTNGQVLDPFNLYPLPDVDFDSHLYVLFATDLTEERDAIVNPVDSLPAELQPSGYGNQHELIVVNTSALVGAELTSEVFITTILRGVFNLMFNTNAPDQPAWMRDALSTFLMLQFQEVVVGANESSDYLAAPQTSLLAPPTLSNRQQVQGGQLLFLTYLTQRYGDQALLDLYSAQGDGMAPLDATFAALDISDPITGEVVTSADAFADFVMTNGLNGNFGDGRYIHRIARLNRGQNATGTTLSGLPQTVDGVAGPYSAQYFEYNAPEAQTVAIHFEAETVERLNLPTSAAPANRFYWSGRGANRDHTLTRAFDLREVDSATLTYDVWYDLAESWNYAYLEVSTNGGTSWEIVRADNSSDINRFGAAYGPGYTGISNPEGPRPFPAIGIQVGADDVTIENVVPGGAADAAGLQVGDVMVGYDGAPWPAAPNVIRLLEDYAPGDTLNLLIRRGQRQLEVPVVLGASTTRIVQPEPRWLPQSVDLSAYAGQDILIRFEYVSVPTRWNEGIALDNIALPELDYVDDAEGETDWTLAGWEIVDNEVSAQFQLQAATFGVQGVPPRVRRLLDPGDASSGPWQVALQQNEWLLVIVSGMNTDTVQDAAFTLEIRDAGEE